MDTLLFFGLIVEKKAIGNQLEITFGNQESRIARCCSVLRLCYSQILLTSEILLVLSYVSVMNSLLFMVLSYFIWVQLTAQQLSPSSTMVCIANNATSGDSCVDLTTGKRTCSGYFLVNLGFTAQRRASIKRTTSHALWSLFVSLK